MQRASARRNQISIESKIARQMSRLGSSDYEERINAIEKLGDLFEDKGAPQELLAMLSDKDELVRVTAAEVLGNLGDIKARPALWKHANDSSPLVRSYIARAIGQVGTMADTPNLRNWLRKERSQYAKIGIYESLYRLGNPEYLLHLLNLLHSKDYRIRCAVAHVLSDLVDCKYVAEFVRSVLKAAVGNEKTIAAQSSYASAIKDLDRFIKKNLTLSQ